MTRDEWIVVGIAGAVLVAAGMFISAGQARSAQKVMLVACMNNQSIIATAIHSAALENNWTEGEPIVIDKVTAFLRDGQLPQCHAGGQYVIGKVGEWPRCTVHGELKMGEPNRLAETDP
jgi:hypothetical protein